MNEESLYSKIVTFLRISRAKIQLGTPPHPLLGLILGVSSLSSFFSLPSLLYILLYFLLITFACNINCLYDVAIDRKYKIHLSSGVDVLGKDKVKKLIFIEGVFIFSIILTLFWEGYVKTSVLALSGLAMGYIYSAEPMRIKKRGILSPFPVLIGLYTLPVLGGWFIFKDTLTLYIVVFTIGYALLNEGITLVNTCEDYQEDKIEDIKTWAHVLGLRSTMRWAFILTISGGLTAILGVVLKPILLGWTSYNIYSSLIFIILGILNTLLILNTSYSIYSAGNKDDLITSCKQSAKNMPKWFISTRYPLLLMAAIIIYI